MKITIKDLARMANVSPATVSLVLNNKPSRISDKKKQEIKALAQTYHYQPNFSAQNLVTKRSNTIGLIIPDIENGFFASLAKSIEESLKAEGYLLILSNSNGVFEDEVALIENLVNRGIDGLLLTVSEETYQHQSQMIEILSKLSVPFVMMDRTFEDFSCNQVYFNHQLGGYLATQYAINQGHHHIGCLTTRSKSLNGYFRYKGYQKALKDYHLIERDDYVAEGEYKFESGYELADRLLNIKELTAVVAANDLMAYGFIKRAKEVGKKIPNDILVVGYDNLKFSQMLNLELPSIDQDINQLGTSSVQVLMQALKDPKELIKVVLEPKMNM